MSDSVKTSFRTNPIASLWILGCDFFHYMVKHNVKLIDASESDEFEILLYKCLAPMPYRKYSRRQGYLDQAITRGFHKILLVLNGEVVGQIEYAPAEASYYPIFGHKAVVMNCIWVLRKAKGHNFGKLLINHMINKEKGAMGFATIGLEGHWSPWFRRE